MREKRTFLLVNESVKRIAKECVDLAPIDHICIIQKRTRSLDQNSRLHALLSDISKQVEWHNQKYPLDVWKRLCMSAWLRERNESPMLIPSLDGNGVDIVYERTSRLTTAQCGEFMTWCEAFGTEQGVEWSDKWQ